MKNASLFFLSLGILASTSVMAGPCSLNPQGPVMEALSISGPTHILSCDYVTQVEDLITRIQDFSEAKVPVNLLVRASYDGASFDGGLNIEVPERLEFQGLWGETYGVSLYGNMTVVGHEYGHALLEDKILKELGPKYPVVTEYNGLRKDISRLELLVLQNPDSTRHKKLLMQKTESLKHNTETTKYFILSAPYSELYADVVAAYNDSSKSAVFEALYYPQMNDFNYRYVQTRDFNSEFTEKHEVYMNESHGYFALTRNYIGKNFWPVNKTEKGVMLKKIGDAIIIELDKLLKNGSDLPDHKIGNAGLIGTLSKLK